jgi:hypothetical protein
MQVISTEEKKVKEKAFKLPKLKIKMQKKTVFGCLGVFLSFVIILAALSYFVLIRPVMTIAKEAQKLKESSALIRNGVSDLNITQINNGLASTQAQLAEFKKVYEDNTRTLRKLPGAEPYYQDSQHLLKVADESINLGNVVVGILEPYSADLGLAKDGEKGTNMPTQDRIIKLLSLMPQFSSQVNEISDKVTIIDVELQQIDAQRYPTSLPKIVERFGMDSNMNIRQEILSLQSVSGEISKKAPQFEALFNAIPEFMGLNSPKKYLVVLSNNYEIRMAGGFNTYNTVVEFNKGIPQITYSIDTYFIDEGERTGSSFLVNRNVPYFLRNYLYIQDRNLRLYARDATSTSADFPTAADTLLNEFWRKDRSLPQDINGVIQVNNDLAVEMLKVVGPVNTSKFSVLTDQGNYITIPITEFNSENVIYELENIAGGRLKETIGRKDIIKFLAESMFEKVFTSEALNLVNIASVGLDSLSRKDVMLYSFDPVVQQAFEGLGYAGRIKKDLDPSTDYLHVNRSNFGSGKADWTQEGFVSSEVTKKVEQKEGKLISTVDVKIKNPKRPDWYNIDPCCFYNAYMRVYAPIGSKMISISASDGQDVRAAEFTDEETQKTYFESYTKQLKETEIVITYVYELPSTVDINNYKVLIQRQSGVTSDPYTVQVNGKSESFLLNSDRLLELK